MEGRRPSKKQKQSIPADTTTDTVDKTTPSEVDKFQGLFGFRKSDLTSWNNFVRLLSRPTDPASLACFRFCFGFLMCIDIFEERGLAFADVRWGDEEQCSFPLFSFLRPLPLEWMIILYMFMMIGAAGIMLGAMYRVSCTMFLLLYWYVLLLDKSTWNNHSYLFGVLTFLLLLTDANRYWSLDGLVKSDIHNADVPLWNYTLLRAQVFLVYFLAGLKKLDTDWVTGYSMEDLSENWVFRPFRLFLTAEQVDFFIVHMGGLFIDLFVGFLLFFEYTNELGLLICVSFHLMNSQIFPIGMFPYVMLATAPLFSEVNWPREQFQSIPRVLRLFTPDDSDDTRPSQHCLYSKEEAKPEQTSSSDTKESACKQKTPHTQTSFRHHAAAAFCVVFILWQIFLPFSHFITKGYNSWTQGLYGYSWDMMIHSRSTQHIRITFVDKDTGEQGYLNPTIWARSTRWSSQPDMMKQYAECIARNLHKHGVNNVELYFDVWISLNSRFQQRTVDPRVDIMTAEWNTFQTTPWIMPLLVDLSNWRSKLVEIKTGFDEKTLTGNTVFVADFPGLHLENFVHADFKNASIAVLQGQVTVELLPVEGNDSLPKNVTLQEGQNLQIPAGQFHNVYTVSEKPSCYMYQYINTTEEAFMEGLKKFQLSMGNSTDKKIPPEFADDPHAKEYMDILYPAEVKPQSFRKRLEAKLLRRYTEVMWGFHLIRGALQSVFMGHSLRTYLKELNITMLVQ